MKTVIGLWTCCLLVCCHAVPLRAEERPNVLLITIDDLNDWVGCLGGHPQARTPRIDALARRGVLFKNAHCQAPICNPSRVSFMTGIRPSTSGVYLNNHRFRKSETIADAVTLSQHFAADGYATLGCGKLYHGSGGQDNFQTYGPAGGQGPMSRLQLNGPAKGKPSRGLWDWGPFPEDEADTHDVEDAQWAAAQLGREREDAFFLGVGFYRPHVPFYAPPKWFQERPLEHVKLPPIRPDDRDDIPVAGLELTRNSTPPPHDWFLESGGWRSAVQAYLACTTFTDHCVGMVIDALDAGPHADDTWIILLSDHGFHLGEKARWAKQALWERATKVPLIVVPPRGEKAAGWVRDAVCPQPVELLDIYPTLIEVCGLSANQRLEGRSLAPLLKNPAAERKFPALTTYQEGNHAVRSVHWRYIRYGDGSEELYDHRVDPHEWSNLADDPEKAAVLSRHRKWLPRVNAPAMRSDPAGGKGKGKNRARKKKKETASAG